MCRKAAVVPSFAQIVEQDCGRNHPRQAHYTLQLCMHRLFRCQIRKHTEGKGGPRTATASGSDVCAGDSFSSGALGAPNLLSDPRGVRFGTNHYLVCWQHWVTLGW